MPERLAKDVMIPMAEYATVRADDNLKNAIKVLRNSLASGHRTLAVLNGNENLVGFLTVRTILKALEVLAFKDTSIAAASGTDVPLLGSWSGFFLKSRLERVSKVKVSEVMRPVFKVCVNEDTPLRDVAKVILKNQVNHIPVLNKERKAVGIIRTVDVLDILGSFLED